MVRKDIPMRQVYDARALRVIVDDVGGTRTADAWAAAYRSALPPHNASCTEHLASLSCRTCETPKP